MTRNTQQEIKYINGQSVYTKLPNQEIKACRLTWKFTCPTIKLSKYFLRNKLFTEKGTKNQAFSYTTAENLCKLVQPFHSSFWQYIQKFV